MKRAVGRFSWVCGLVLLALVAPGHLAAAEAPASAQSQPQPPRPKRASVLRSVLLYLPNRLLDTLDVFSLGIGVPSVAHVFPATFHVNAHATRAVQAGLGSTHGLFVGKDFRRRLAWGMKQDEISIGPFTVTQLERFQGEGEASAKVGRAGVLQPSDEPFAKDMTDYWAVGAHAGAILLAVQADIHPVEILDVLFGFFFVDISRDDL